MIPLAIEEIESLGLGELNGFGEITGLEIDSRRVGPGDLFVAIRGGREFVGDGARPRRRHARAERRVRRDGGARPGAARAGAARRFVGVTGSTGQDVDEGHPRGALRDRRADGRGRRGATTPSSACR